MFNLHKILAVSQTSNVEKIKNAATIDYKYFERFPISTIGM